MQLLFWPSSKVRTVQCRRGSNVYRKQEVPAGDGIIEYQALNNCTVELVEDGKVVGSHELQFNVPNKVILKPNDDKVSEAFAPASAPTAATKLDQAVETKAVLSQPSGSKLTSSDKSSKIVESESDVEEAEAEEEDAEEEDESEE